MNGAAFWDAQDALFSAFDDQEELEDAAIDLGHPANIEPLHVWIAGESEGSQNNDLSGNPGPTDETFTLTVFSYAQSADDYVVVRGLLGGLLAGVRGALASPGFGAVVPAWRVQRRADDEGTDGQNRQLATELVIECRCW